MIRLTLPYPPSNNRVTRRGKGRSYKPRNVRSFRAACAAMARAQYDGEPLDCKMAVTILAWPPKRRGGRSIDVDNLPKALLDALEGIAYVNDSKVERLVVERMPREGDGRIVMEICEHDIH